MREHKYRGTYRINTTLYFILTDYCYKNNTTFDMVINPAIIQESSRDNFTYAEQVIKINYPEYLELPLDLVSFTPSKEPLSKGQKINVNIKDFCAENFKLQVYRDSKFFNKKISMNLFINFCIARELVLEKDYIAYRNQYDADHKVSQSNVPRLELDRLKPYDSGLEIADYYYDKDTGIRNNKPRRNSLLWKKDIRENFDKSS